VKPCSLVTITTRCHIIEQLSLKLACLILSLALSEGETNFKIILTNYNRQHYHHGAILSTWSCRWEQTMPMLGIVGLRQSSWYTRADCYISTQTTFCQKQQHWGLRVCCNIRPRDSVILFHSNWDSVCFEVAVFSYS
jgi:hypothetical protein